MTWITCPNCGEKRDTSNRYTSPANAEKDARDWKRDHKSGACVAAEKAYAILGREIDLDSEREVRVALFDQLQLDLEPGRYAFVIDDALLRLLWLITKHPFVGALIDYRRTKKNGATA
jgi:DNA polymerase I-like protein with 3'-5' exonuclease and polymerase domains